MGNVHAEDRMYNVWTLTIPATSMTLIRYTEFFLGFDALGHGRLAEIRHCMQKRGMKR